MDAFRNKMVLLLLAVAVAFGSYGESDLALTELQEKETGSDPPLVPPEPEVEHRPNPKTEPKPEPRSEPKPEPKPEPEPEPEPKTEPEPEPEPDWEAEYYEAVDAYLAAVVKLGVEVKELVALNVSLDVAADQADVAEMIRISPLRSASGNFETLVGYYESRIRRA